MGIRHHNVGLRLANKNNLLELAGEDKQGTLVRAVSLWKSLPLSVRAKAYAASLVGAE